MLNYFKRPQISSVLFVAASLATFILLGALFIFLKINWLTDGRTDENSNERYYFKNTDKTDPLITKMPDINNMLAGPIISQNDPNLGSETAPVVIVEFSDFLCRFCQEQEKILSAVIKKYPDKIRLIWKDYPEDKPDSISFQAALAGRCANEQKQFWPYHDLLYQNSADLSQEKLIQLAKELDLDEKKFQQCLTAEQTKKLVEDNIIEANALAISGIPFIYLNQQEIMGQTTLKDLENIIDLELTNKK